MSKRGFGAVVVFLIGCATGGAASRMVPPASAQQQAAVSAQQFAMPVFAHWEYRCEPVTRKEELEPLANSFGQAGWGMAGTYSGSQTGIFCFKRPLPPK